MFPPHAWLNPVLPAAAGLALALLALVAILFGARTRLGVPVLGLLMSSAALGIAAYQGGVRDVNSGRAWVGGQVTQIRQLVPKSATAPPTNSGVPTNPAGPGVSATPPAAGPNPGRPDPGGVGPSVLPGPTVGQPGGAGGAGAGAAARPAPAGADDGVARGPSST